MATVMRTQRHDQLMSGRSSLQKITIGVGILFLVLGVIGIVMPGFMSLHLSMAHNLIHLASGVLALWVGYSSFSNRAYNYCVAFGSVYGLLGVAGFFLGEPGYPAVGSTRADDNLLRVIPNILEFGTMDHILHLALSVVLLAGAYLWKREEMLKGKRTISSPMSSSDSTQKVTGSASQLGEQDLNHITKIKDRTDYEKRI